jgi:hypothetical protein
MAQNAVVTGTGSGSRGAIAQRLDVIGWALFFIWCGIALLSDFKWGIGLIGVAVIVLGMQLVRRSYGLLIRGLWVVVGMLFLLGGIWELWGFKFSTPVLLIVIGGALLASVLLGFHRHDE